MVEIGKGIYKSMDKAVHRVDVLKQSGIWPGIIMHDDGTCSLTYDPIDITGK